MAITTFESLDELAPAVGRHLGTSDWMLVDAERVALFDQAVGAGNGPADSAMPLTDGGPTVPPHLLLSLSNLFLPAIVDIQGASAGLNYGTGPVRFPSSLPVGARAQGSAELVAVDEVPGGVQTTIRITIVGEGHGEPVCIVDAIGRYLY